MLSALASARRPGASRALSRPLLLVTSYSLSRARHAPVHAVPSPGSDLPPATRTRRFLQAETLPPDTSPRVGGGAVAPGSDAKLRAVGLSASVTRAPGVQSVISLATSDVQVAICAVTMAAACPSTPQSSRLACGSAGRPLAASVFSVSDVCDPRTPPLSRPQPTQTDGQRAALSAALGHTWLRDAAPLSSPPAPLDSVPDAFPHSGRPARLALRLRVHAPRRPRASESRALFLASVAPRTATCRTSLRHAEMNEDEQLCLYQNFLLRRL